MRSISRASGPAAAIALAIAGTAHASSIINGGFESGTASGWNAIGNTSVQTADFGSGPAGGTYQGLLISNGASIGSLETFLGLNAGDINAALNNPGATQGSAYAQSVTGISAGDVLSFSFNFLTTEENPSPGNPYNDSSFLSLVNTTTGEVTVLADVNSSSLVASATPFAWETGYASFSHTFTAGGDYTIGFGVVDLLDAGFPSGLLIDEIMITTPIPLPAPVWMGLAGLGGVVALRRRMVR